MTEDKAYNKAQKAQLALNMMSSRLEVAEFKAKAIPEYSAFKKKTGDFIKALTAKESEMRKIYVIKAMGVDAVQQKLDECKTLLYNVSQHCALLGKLSE